MMTSPRLTEVMSALTIGHATKNPAHMAAALDALFAALDARELAVTPITRVSADEAPPAFSGFRIVLTRVDRCRVCNGRLEAGDTALWAKAYGVAHCGCGREVPRGRR